MTIWRPFAYSELIMFKTTVCSHLNFVTWCIVLLETSSEDGCSEVIKGRTWSEYPPHHYTTSCLNHSYKALCIHAFMLTSNSDPAVQMWQQKVRVSDQPAVQVWRALICSWEEGYLCHCNPLRYHSSPFLNWGPWPRTSRCQFFSGPRLSTRNCCGVRWRSLLSEVNKKLLLSKSKNKIL